MAEIRILKCAVCGAEIKNKRDNSLYCATCAHDRQLEARRKCYENKKRKAHEAVYNLRSRRQKQLDISEINKRARALNMSYGQYVAREGV